MAQETFTIPDQHVALFIDAFAEGFEVLQAQGLLPPGVSTKVQYARVRYKDYLASYVRGWKLTRDKDVVAVTNVNFT